MIDDGIAVDIDQKKILNVISRRSNLFNALSPLCISVYCEELTIQPVGLTQG